jgi:hypothetical protein
MAREKKNRSAASNLTSRKQDAAPSKETREKLKISATISKTGSSPSRIGFGSRTIEKGLLSSASSLGNNGGRSIGDLESSDVFLTLKCRNYSRPVSHTLADAALPFTTTGNEKM